MNHDNIVKRVPRIQLVDSTSKAGNPYTQIKLHFINGYTFTAFVNAEQKFAIQDALKKQLDPELSLDQVD